MMVRKANTVGEETSWAIWLYHWRTLSMHMTGGVTVTLLSAILQHQTSTTMDCVCQITLNQTLSWNWKSGVYFQVKFKQNQTKINCIKRDLPVHCISLLEWEQLILELKSYQSWNVLWKSWMTSLKGKVHQSLQYQNHCIAVKVPILNQW